MPVAVSLVPIGDVVSSINSARWHYNAPQQSRRNGHRIYAHQQLTRLARCVCSIVRSQSERRRAVVAHTTSTVTGCSSGLGLALIQEVLASGERVVATLRKPADIASLADKYPSTQLLVEQLDVTDAARTKAVFEATRAHFGRLDVVVNNAGYGMQGEFETFPEEAAKAMMDVLFWGPARICREVREAELSRPENDKAYDLLMQAIRFMREVNPPGQGGRILNITSMGGFVGFPTGSFYHAGKFGQCALRSCMSK